MKNLMLLLLLLLAPTAEAQLSTAAVTAFYTTHMCAPYGAPPGTAETLLALGSRRFASNTVTFKVQPVTGTDSAQYKANVRNAMVKTAEYMAGITTYTEVPWNQNATLIWRIGTSYTTSTGQTIALTNGCVYNPLTFVGGDWRLTATAEVVCRRVPQVSLDMTIHEFWMHGLLTYCDPGSAPAWSFHSTASGAPNYEAVPGHRELVRWLNSVPAGSQP